MGLHFVVDEDDGTHLVGKSSLDLGHHADTDLANVVARHIWHTGRDVSLRTVYSFTFKPPVLAIEHAVSAPVQ